MRRIYQCPECGHHWTTPGTCDECEVDTVEVTRGRWRRRSNRPRPTPLPLRLFQALVGAVVVGALFPLGYWAKDAERRGEWWDPRDDWPLAIGIVVCCAITGALVGFMLPRGMFFWSEETRPPPRWMTKRRRDSADGS